MRVLCLIATLLTLAIDAPVGAARDETLAAIRRHAFDAAYNLDYPEAVRLFDQAIARDPNDSATHRARAVATWLHMVFARGSISVDQYMGQMAAKDLSLIHI